ncbi:hypothetical protein [Shewanella gaetbuli]
MPTTKMWLVSLPIMFALTGCNGTEEVKQPQPEQPKAEQIPAKADVQATEAKHVEQADKLVSVKPQISPQKGIKMMQGTVRYMNLEGGFWGIVADNGQQILPQSLPQEFKQDGLRLSFTSSEITDMMTIQQWGTLSNVSDIKVIGEVDSKANHPTH